MVVGFNHNFRYKGEIFHVQTEDGGAKNPQVVTLLYRGGSILSSKKTSYADLCRKDNLTTLVEELMKEQHREMLRRLKDGEFDEIIDKMLSDTIGEATPPRTTSPPKEEPKKAAVVSSDSHPSAPKPDAPAEAPVAATPKTKPAAAAASLDDIILSYLIGEDK
ncbi:MAG: hypothetical protein A2X84_02950 [Desulfuromonadaceae bacterium GWC2_58_13]|nr:MAG: hypothetical protein A2X84_02950 [Desulfuromonadaceae bacterium GWC2_58_13]